MSAQRDQARSAFRQRESGGDGGGISVPRGRGTRHGNGPMFADVSFNGDDIHVGQRRRRTHSESQVGMAIPLGRTSLRAEAAPFSPSSPSSGGVWVNRSLYEQADGSLQSWLSGSPPTGSSPRERPRTLVFRSRRNLVPGPTTFSSNTTQQRGHNYKEDNQENHHHRQALKQGGGNGGRGQPNTRGRQFMTRTHYRSSSEPKRVPRATESGGQSRVPRTGESGGQGRGGRRRGNSETERTPQKKSAKSAAMSGLQCLMQDAVWFDKPRYDEAERRFYEGMNGVPQSSQPMKTALQPGKGQARASKQRHPRTTSTSSTGGGDQTDLVARMKSLELENQTLHKAVNDMRNMMSKLESRLTALEKAKPAATVSAAPTAAPAAKTVIIQSPKRVEVREADDDEDDFDLFGSDEEDEEAERLKAERVKAYDAKKSKKPVLIAKSSILLDVKPWDDETDMGKLEECVRSVQTDGLLWGASKLVPVGYGIKKLQISCVVEDDKVGTDYLEEEITKFEDYVQSVDVAAFNKI